MLSSPRIKILFPQINTGPVALYEIYTQQQFYVSHFSYHEKLSINLPLQVEGGFYLLAYRTVHQQISIAL